MPVAIAGTNRVQPGPETRARYTEPFQPSVIRLLNLAAEVVVVNQVVRLRPTATRDEGDSATLIQIDAHLHLAVVEEDQLAGSNRPGEAKGQSAGDEESEPETHASKIGNHTWVA